MSRPVPDSDVAVGVRWAQRMIAIGFEFALPPLAGSWLDGRLRTGRLLTIAGAIFGFLAGMIHLMAIAREASRPRPSPPPRETSDGPNESG